MALDNNVGQQADENGRVEIWGINHADVTGRVVQILQGSRERR